MEKIRVGVIVASEDVRIPEYKTPEASGADVVSTEDVELAPGDIRLVHTGLHLDIPVGYEIQVRARSGLSLKHGITVLNGIGTIDSDYQGEVGVILVNHSRETWVCHKGERIGQFVLARVEQADFVPQESYDRTTERGTGGYGSTGK